MIYHIRRGPLGLEIHETRMRDERLEPRSRPRLERVREMASVTRSTGDLPGGIDERKAANRFIRALDQLLGRTTQRIALNVLRELLADSCRSGVVPHQQHVALPSQQMIVPAQPDQVTSLVVRTSVAKPEQRIFLFQV